MSHGHLTDNQLQDYLDGNIRESDALTAHVQSCPQCRRALETYAHIYMAIEKNPIPELSPGFVDDVMARLPEKTPVAETALAGRFRVRDSVVTFAVMIVAVAVAVYYLDLPVLIKPFLGLADHSLNPESRALGLIADYVRKFNISYLAVIFSVLTFAGIGAIDHVLARRKRHQQPISYMI